MEYPGFNGFLGTRASLMLDVVFLAMFAVLPVLAWSIYQVKVRRRWVLHKWVQLVLGAVLLVTVLAFEIDMRVHGWRERAAASPFYAEGAWSAVEISLWVHLLFAITSAVLWVVVLFEALRRFPAPPRPGEHSRRHKRLGWLAAVDMALTAITGWIFYLLAFAA